MQVAGGKIRSFPMKGTLDARLPNARELLRNDPKERAEHATITDLIRNDLSRVAEQVTVERYAYIDEIPTHRNRLLRSGLLKPRVIRLEDLAGYQSITLFNAMLDFGEVQLPVSAIHTEPVK